MHILDPCFAHTKEPQTGWQNPVAGIRDEKNVFEVLQEWLVGKGKQL